MLLFFILKLIFNVDCQYQFILKAYIFLSLYNNNIKPKKLDLIGNDLEQKSIHI